MEPDDERYLELLLEPIRHCAQYRPRFGQGQAAGLALADFEALYRADVFYVWFGLDNPLMYAAHKAAGGMTSIYRQIGIGCERLFRTVLQDVLGLSAEDVMWSYQVPSRATRRVRTLSLDARISLAAVVDRTARQRLHEWMLTVAQRLGVARSIARALAGTVFEVRQGYKSKDSKRQNADIANAASAYAKAYLPCALILSSQIDTDVMARYMAQGWVVLRGTLGAANAYESTYDFARQVLGYDLAGFFQRNSALIRREVDQVLRCLLSPGI
jgi:hypothetical protein